MADSKKYDGSQWEHSLRKQTTASEIIVPPTTIYADGTAISTYIIKGNTVQNGTPSPSDPVPVVGVGELETTGEHTGEYKTPILNGQQTTNIYLGSVQSTRRIKKLVLTGTEDWIYQSDYNRFLITISDVAQFVVRQAPMLCTHYQVIDDGRPISDVPNNSVYFNNKYLCITTTDQSSKTDLNNYLAAQYANGTPVTIWYVLATATTGTVNESLMKIGTYADTLSNATAIPTTDGANSITIDTTVQPSEFAAAWTGWHDSSVKEWDGTQWN